MKECLLCERDMKTAKTIFGNGCIKSIYKLLNLEMPRKVKDREQYLYKSIMKKVNAKWNLSVKIEDRYDYTKLKGIKEYYKDANSVPKSMFSSLIYNLAFFSVKFGVIKEYYVNVEFDINEYEVN